MRVVVLKNNKGVALIVTILLMSLILLLSLYFLDFSVTEKRISQSQTWGIETYYLAEAGIAEMVWQLKNNEIYKNNFETNSTWTETLIRNNPFGADSGSYTVTITNSNEAHGEIVSTGSMDVGVDSSSQRVIKTNVYKALGQSGIGDNGGLGNGNIEISWSLVNFVNCSAYSNGNFTTNGISVVNIDNDLEIVGNFSKSWLSTVNVGGDIYASNYPLGIAPEIEMPAVDFDSDDPESFKNRADIIYKEDDFKDLLKNNENLTLNSPITYINGSVEIKGNQNLIVNGLLVISGNVEIGKDFCWEERCGFSSITVNYTPGIPAGILVKGNLQFEEWTGDVDVTGLIYTSGNLEVLSFPFGHNFDIVGGMIGNNLNFSGVLRTINITHSGDILDEVLTPTEFSPVITVEHWEEEY